MRYVMLGVGLLVASVVGGALWIDEGEVVILRTSDAQGQAFETHLWIAEVGGDLYLRGAPTRSWVERIRAQPLVEVERGAGRQAYRAALVDDPAVAAAVNAAMQQKYGSAERIADLVIEHREPVAIRLEPVPAAHELRAGGEPHAALLDTNRDH